MKPLLLLLLVLASSQCYEVLIKNNKATPITVQVRIGDGSKDVELPAHTEWSTSTYRQLLKTDVFAAIMENLLADLSPALSDPNGLTLTVRYRNEGFSTATGMNIDTGFFSLPIFTCNEIVQSKCSGTWQRSTRYEAVIASFQHRWAEVKAGNCLGVESRVKIEVGLANK
ncbi:hypothetical protein PMAYCL1PPCAC_26453 [Pristionchus mayeri]|uniref:Uncharacterized protein n=1 Tax=Pristionchus mayeri TaxID=1317129 RepID=A0AAN5D479_9BILA|nr:hypothetical protein PMAYCL1PPCAC_26453 [Pristionchus mayeri]